MKRNWEALVLKAMGGQDFRLTVLGSEPVSGPCLRLRLHGGGLLETHGVHPTMWVRLWFDNGGKVHQRAYTLVDPDPATGEFSLEFAVHDGPAPRWAAAAQPGDTIEATLQGSAFAMPEPAPRHLYLIGDAASLPAVNSLLDTAPATPVTLWFEYARDDEKDLPLRTREQHTVHWVPRRDDGRHLVDTVSAALPAAENGAYYWIAAEAASTRSLARHVRRGLGVDKQHVCALAYWKAA